MKFWKFQYAGPAQAKRCVETRSLPPNQDFPSLANTYVQRVQALKIGDGVLLAQLNGDKAHVFAVGVVRAVGPVLVDWAATTKTLTPDRRLGLKNWKTKSAFEISSAPAKRYGLQELLEQHILRDIKHHEFGSDAALEGYLYDRKLLSSSRNSALVKRRKVLDKYQCQSCSFCLKVNDQFVIEVHHLEPLKTTGPRTTTIDRLVSLCPVCHRIAHLRNPPYEVHEIQSILRSQADA